MHSYRSGLLPNKFNDMFLSNYQVHSYNTRSAMAIRTPLCRTNIRQFSVRFQGPKFFNLLPIDIINITSFVSFKRKLKNYLL